VSARNGADEDALDGVALRGRHANALLSMRVNNTAEGRYELRLQSVTTDGGETIPANTSTDEITPGRTGFATWELTLPAGARPASVTVVTIRTENGEPRRTERSITLGRL